MVTKRKTCEKGNIYKYLEHSFSQNVTSVELPFSFLDSTCHSIIMPCIHILLKWKRSPCSSKNIFSFPNFYWERIFSWKLLIKELQRVCYFVCFRSIELTCLIFLYILCRLNPLLPWRHLQMVVKIMDRLFEKEAQKKLLCKFLVWCKLC